MTPPPPRRRAPASGPPAPPQAPSPPDPDPLADPLADLRDDDDGTETTAILNDPDAMAALAEAEAEFLDLVEPVPTVTQEQWDRARTQAIVAMHADTTTVGFLHKGGQCGCNYIAGVILQVALPIGTEPEPEPAPEGVEV